MGTQDRILIDINNHYQIAMDQHKKLSKKIKYKSIESNIFIVSAAYLFKSFLSYIYLGKEIAKTKFLPAGGL